MTQPADIAAVVQQAQQAANGNPATAAIQLQVATLWMLGDIAASLRTLATAATPRSAT